MSKLFSILSAVAVAVLAIGVAGTSPALAETYRVSYGGNQMPEDKGWEYWWGNDKGYFEGDPPDREIVAYPGRRVLRTDSTENWLRPKDEVNELMRLFGWALRHEVPKLNKNNVRMAASGRVDGLPQQVRGFETVKEEQLARVQDREAELFRAFENALDT